MTVVASTVLAAAGCATSQTVRAPPRTEVVNTVGPGALGVNIAAWDAADTGSSSVILGDVLRSVGLHLIRFPGGSWADQYDWSTNTDTALCTGPVTHGCVAGDPLGFEAISAQARSTGASTFVTVNYGTGSPGQAAAWVAHSRAHHADGVALWEVGNESYSCHEANDHLAEPPTSVRGYRRDGPVCPRTAVMARSYAAHSVPYLQAMQKADPRARIGVPWAFTSAEAGGASVTDAGAWNDMVLRADRPYVDFVDAHWYPFDSVAGVTEPQIIDSVRRIPAAAAAIRRTLGRLAPHAGFVVGETNISERETGLAFEPVAALFAAATSLEWTVVGAENVDWWDLNNFGTPAVGDYGLVSSGSPESQPVGTPLPAYYGEKLASMLTRAGSRITVVDTHSSSLIGYRSDLRRQRRVLLVNADPDRPDTVASTWFATGSPIQVMTYSAAGAATAHPIQTSDTSAVRRVALPAQSIVVLSGTPHR